jgi:hypothetical protein
MVVQPLQSSNNGDNATWQVFWNVGGGWGDTHNDTQGTCPPADLGTQFNVSLDQLGNLPQNFNNVGENCCLEGCHQWNDGLSYIDPGAWAKGRLVPIDGGVPQAVNMTAHLVSVRAGVARWIPSAAWSGNAVIDFDAWHPLWEFNNEHDPPRMNRYQNLSLQLVQQEHPHWSVKQQLVEAEKQFNAGALDILVHTLRAAKAMRPAARWGYYGYPSGCVQLSKPSDFSPLIRNGELCRAANDKLAALWAETTGFFPAIYLAADAGHGWPS